MSSTHPSNAHQTQFVQAPQHNTPLVSRGGDILLARHTVNISGLGWKHLGRRRLNPPESGFVTYVRVMWYDKSITIISFVIPSNTDVLTLVGKKPDNQMHSFLQYPVNQYIQ